MGEIGSESDRLNDDKPARQQRALVYLAIVMDLLSRVAGGRAPGSVPLGRHPEEGGSHSLIGRLDEGLEPGVVEHYAPGP